MAIHHDGAHVHLTITNHLIISNHQAPPSTPQQAPPTTHQPPTHHQPHPPPPTTTSPSQLRPQLRRAQRFSRPRLRASPPAASAAPPTAWPGTAARHLHGGPWRPRGRTNPGGKGVVKWLVKWFVWRSKCLKPS